MKIPVEQRALDLQIVEINATLLLLHKVEQLLALVISVKFTDANGDTDVKAVRQVTQRLKSEALAAAAREAE